MNLFADKQTLDDLNLLGKFKNRSVFSLFNHALTRGGEKLLQEMFNCPLNDYEKINRRSNEFRFFQEFDFKLSFDTDELNEIESYLGTGGKGHWLESTGNVLRRQLLNLSGLHGEYEVALTGISHTNKLLLHFRQKLIQLQEMAPENPFSNAIREFIYLPLLNQLTSGPYSFQDLIRFDHLFRHVYYTHIKDLLRLIYKIDVCCTVALTAKQNQLSYATALPKNCQIIYIKGCRYPGLHHGIGNDITLNKDNNMLFLTGANMAGKSTLMKSFGISCYLAHMGFPVPAEEMTFSVKEGLYTSINVPDNINQGHSHYYAEVLRVKNVALEVGQSKDLFIVFDELFKGTNVKDAYDATLAVTEAYAENRNCFFIISTHIIEVGEVLKERCSNITFSYLPTEMNANIPKYTYKLQDGITSDRHGMRIIKNERILEILSDNKI
jgi:DNA mismatch repair protein MutS